MITMWSALYAKHAANPFHLLQVVALSFSEGLTHLPLDNQGPARLESLAFDPKWPGKLRYKLSSE